MGAVLDSLLQYETVKIVQVKSKKVGLTFRLIQLAIVLYVIGYAIIIEKGYQLKQPVAGVVTTKVKGVSYPSDVDDPVYRRVFDVADYVTPAQQESSFFVMTNVVITPEQSPGVCPEDPEMIDVLCDCDTKECEGQCPPDTEVFLGNGVRTGNCVTSAVNASQKVCEIRAWCPVEVDVLPTEKALLRDAKHYTVFIKNTIEFSQFNFQKRNIFDDINNEDYLKKCRYDPKDELNKFCPIFTLGEIVNDAGEDFDAMAYDGGIIGIFIDWNCNLDLSERECKPVYSFKRLDDPAAKISAGYNFRHASFFREDGVQKRTLYKSTGIRFDVIVRGEAGRFDIKPLVLNIAAGLALLAVATVVCDFLILFLHSKKDFFREQKYQAVIVEEEDGEKKGYGTMEDTKE